MEKTKYETLKWNFHSFSFISSSRLKKRFEVYLSFLFFIVFIFLFFLNLDEIVVVEGEIRPQFSEVTVKCLFSGIVSDVFYKNADFVNEGDILLKIDSTYEKEYMKNLLEIRNFYEKEIKSVQEILLLLNTVSTENIHYDEYLCSTNTKYSFLVAEYQKYKDDYELKRRIFEREQISYPMSISKQELERCENEYKQSFYAFVTWIEQQKLLILEDYTSSRTKLEECKLNIMQTNYAIEKSVIRANNTGYINEIRKVQKGDYISLDTDIVTVIPESDKLKCVVKIPSDCISKIQIGQEILLQIKDLPFIKYGKIKGRISFIPKDVVQSNIPYFPVEAEIDKTYVQGKDKNKVQLRVGTNVDVKIIVDRYTIFQKILQKVICHEN